MCVSLSKRRKINFIQEFVSEIMVMRVFILRNTAYQIGDKVVCKVNSKPLRGTISAIDSRNKRIEVSFDTLRQRGYFKIGTSFQDQANKFIEKPRSQQQRTVSLSESLSSENTSYINK